MTKQLKKYVTTLQALCRVFAQIPFSLRSGLVGLLLQQELCSLSPFRSTLLLAFHLFGLSLRGYLSSVYRQHSESDLSAPSYGSQPCSCLCIGVPLWRHNLHHATKLNVKDVVQRCSNVKIVLPPTCLTARSDLQGSVCCRGSSLGGSGREGFSRGRASVYSCLFTCEKPLSHPALL